jgi:hypothetical protein
VATQQQTTSSSSNSASNFLLTSTTAAAMQQALANVLPQPSTTSVPSTVPTMAYMTPTQYPQSSYPRSVSNAVPTNSLWMGDLEPWMDETFLYSVFSFAPDLVNIKVMKDKATGKPSGFGFIYFANAVSAQRILETYQSQPIPNAPGKYFK